MPAVFVCAVGKRAQGRGSEAVQLRLWCALTALTWTAAGSYDEAVQTGQTSMSITAVLVGALLLGAIVLILRSANRSGQEGAADIRVLVQLRQAGSQLGQPHEIDFFLYFPVESSAKLVALELESKGYSAVVQPSAHGNQEWLLQAGKTMIPTAKALVEIRRNLTELAAGNGGTYDGWGAGVVP